MGVLEGRRAVITGGASGIGAETCRRFAEEGASVAVLDRNGDGAREVAKAVGGIGFEVDVRDADAVSGAVRQAAERMGGLTDLVTNAGTGTAKPLLEYTDKEFALLVGVNLTGTFNTIRAGGQIMMDNGGGSIVTNASLTGLRPTRGEGPYSAAKAGVIALTANVALELAPAVRANCVAPGMIDTPLTAPITQTPAWKRAAEFGTPLARLGTAREVADVIVFLASPAAAYITGQTIVIDGGSVLPSLQSDAVLRAISGG
ncbi:MAG: SDR family oxidoreductase [Acidimicrobiia bacterium]|nr:SDR family oxidoreductase [Acidimicrobiia bacterium]